MTLLARAPQGSDAGAAPQSSRHDSPLPGQLLGEKYRIEARVAEGGMGVVLRATHLELDCRVAIKLIRPEHAENEEVTARLLAEARIAASLRSKHVNHVLDVGRTAHGVPYLVLEYMEGGDLRAYLQRHGRMPITEAVDCVMQSCEALAEAHAFGIVHRDLKPENLFLSEEADGSFVLKVLDFGISKAPAARRGGRTLTNPFEVVGSPNYMAPEQIRGGQVDSRSDIWALGALLYELCTGNVPYAAETITETFSLILDPEYALPPLDAGADSEHIRLVIDRCLRKNPDERYQSVVELADALSPLGSDMLQGRRVAKVAMATRARVLAAGGPHALPSPGTPLALITSLEPERETPEPQREPRGSSLGWLVAGVAAIGLLGLGLAWAALSVESRPATASESIRTHPPEAAPAATEPAAKAGSDFVPPAPPTPADAMPDLERTRRVALPGAPSPQPVRSAVLPAAQTAALYPVLRPPPTPEAVAATAGSAPLATPPNPVVPANADAVVPANADAVVPANADAVVPANPDAVVPANPDAWDPKTFGGRR